MRVCVSVCVYLSLSLCCKLTSGEEQVGHGIRSRNRVAVGHGISSRSHIERTRAALWCRTGALPALVNKLHQVTLAVNTLHVDKENADSEFAAPGDVDSGAEPRAAHQLRS
jgi:hypothetical protein